MAVCPQFLTGSRPNLPASVRQPAWSRVPALLPALSPALLPAVFPALLPAAFPALLPAVFPAVLPDVPPASRRAAAATSAAAEWAPPDALPDAADRSARSAPPDRSLLPAGAYAWAAGRAGRRRGPHHGGGRRGRHDHPYHPGGRAGRAAVPARAADSAAW